MWWDSIGGQLYVYYNDGNSSQWVPSSNQPGPQGASGAIGPTGATGATGPNWTVGTGLTLASNTLSLTTPALPLAGGTLAGTLGVGGSANPQLYQSGAYTVLSANDTATLNRVVAVGNTGDPTTYYRNTTHSFADQSGSNVLLTMALAGQTFGGGGVVCGAPTGGAKGNGTLNAVTVYGNNVMLTSDAGLKRDVGPLPPCLELVRSIEPRSYRWRPLPKPAPIPGPDGQVTHLAGEMSPDFATRRNWGFLAQDVAKASGAHRNDGGVESVDLGGLVACLWEAVRELSDEVETLKGRRR